MIATAGRVTVAAQVAFRDGAVRGSGDVTIADVKTISPDPAAPEDVMAAQTIRLRVRDAGTNPPALDVDSLEVAWPYVLIDRRVDAIFPRERQGVAAERSRRLRQIGLAVHALDDGQNRKYLCASGSTSAGSLVSSSPSARTS